MNPNDCEARGDVGVRCAHPNLPRLSYRKWIRLFPAMVLTIIAGYVLDCMGAEPPADTIHDSLSLESAEKKITKEGLDKAVRAFYADKQGWQKLLAQIATGKGEWLSLAARLRSVSDAGATRDLRLSVAQALKRSPGNVLRTMDNAFTLAEVCGMVDIDDPKYDSYALATAELERQKAALQLLSDSPLKAKRDECVALIEASRDHIRRFYGVEDSQTKR